LYKNERRPAQVMVSRQMQTKPAD